MADVLLPQLGETVTEGTITRWFFGIGETVPADAPLYEVSTEKVDSEVPSPLGGVLVEIIASEGATIPVGALLCRIDPDDPSSTSPLPTPSAVAGAGAGGTGLSTSEQGSGVPAGSDAVVASAAAAGPAGATGTGVEHRGRAGVRLLSPVVRRLLAENGLDPARVRGTGLGGRLTRGDVETFLRDNPERAEPFNGIRKATARHMVGSKATSPHVLTAMEVDFDAVDRLRYAEKDAWRDAEGSSLTYLPFIVAALAEALAAFPRLNASVGDDELIVHGDVNLAVAVDLGFEGLVAPVVRKVGDLSIRDLARSIHEVAGRARDRRLVPDDLSGGTFTVTNPGQYGTLFQFPIINQPQVAILSTDGIARKPAVVVDADGVETIGVRPLGILALAWDHRAFDGAYAAAFLQELKRILETTDWVGRWADEADGA
ncbi:MAG: dihydrolipoamide acetyltransferase family protein [Acidimicrobiales bacterium]|jgi:2-oxoglutarate dehydrogenase E2 component (dihydrolipoamide succinyltransferase)|nr:2-oxo acid dehydrogenase subunit E2 [Acidimicrobiia bacterium]